MDLPGTDHGFHSTFRWIGDSRDFSPEAWAESFRPAAIPLWEKECGGCVIHTGPDGAKQSLIMAYMDGLLCVTYDDVRSTWIYAPDGSLASKFTVAADGSTVPAGSGASLEKAGALVRAFLSTPAKRPDGPWVDVESLEWPEDF